MTIEEFKEKVDGVPLTLDEVAELMTQCDDEGMKYTGSDYINATEDLLDKLEELEIELG